MSFKPKKSQQERKAEIRQRKELLKEQLEKNKEEDEILKDMRKPSTIRIIKSFTNRAWPTDEVVTGFMILKGHSYEINPQTPMPASIDKYITYHDYNYKEREYQWKWSGPINKLHVFKSEQVECYFGSEEGFKFNVENAVTTDENIQLKFKCKCKLYLTEHYHVVRDTVNRTIRSYPISPLVKLGSNYDDETITIGELNYQTALYNDKYYEVYNIYIEVIKTMIAPSLYYDAFWSYNSMEKLVKKQPRIGPFHGNTLGSLQLLKNTELIRYYPVDFTQQYIEYDPLRHYYRHYYKDQIELRRKEEDSIKQITQQKTILGEPCGCSLLPYIH